MKKQIVYLALAAVVRVASAGPDQERVQALEETVAALRQDVVALQDQSRQKRTGIHNPDISAAVDAIASYSDAAGTLNFTARDVELMVQANADPFAKAYVVFNAESELEPTETSNPFGEASLGMEEAAIQTTALPYGLAVKAGAYFADFTRLGRVHSHDLPFTDRPVSLEQVLGGEDKARGVELTWLPPLDHYVRFTAGVVDDIGAETAVNGTLATADGEEVDAFAAEEKRALDAAMLYGRLATMLDLGPGAVLHLGADAAQGGNAGTRTLASTDFKLEWKPVAGGNRLFELAAEWLTSKADGTLAEAAVIEGGPRDASAEVSGGYVYAQYRMTPIWQPGVRFDLTEPEWFEAGEAGLVKVDDSRQTVSAYLNAHLSEFNRLRAQVNVVSGDSEIANGQDTDTQVFLQWTVMLGAHKHDFIP
ncbi:MAG: hypothetical protein K8T26_19130 [Lentisphaerae bacterium]|nr:hypothetical protein [Lentisphaerota bacterium]